MPALVQAAATGPVQTSDALAKPSSNGCLMLSTVTHTGVASADGTSLLVSGSVTEPVASEDASWPLISAIASLEAASASRLVFL